MAVIDYASILGRAQQNLPQWGAQIGQTIANLPLTKYKLEMEQQERQQKAEALAQQMQIEEKKLVLAEQQQQTLERTRQAQASQNDIKSVLAMLQSGQPITEVQKFFDSTETGKLNPMKFAPIPADMLRRYKQGGKGGGGGTGKTPKGPKGIFNTILGGGGGGNAFGIQPGVSAAPAKAAPSEGKQTVSVNAWDSEHPEWEKETRNFYTVTTPELGTVVAEGPNFEAAVGPVKRKILDIWDAAYKDFPSREGYNEAKVALAIKIRTALQGLTEDDMQHMGLTQPQLMGYLKNVNPTYYAALEKDRDRREAALESQNKFLEANVKAEREMRNRKTAEADARADSMRERNINTATAMMDGAFANYQGLLYEAGVDPEMIPNSIKEMERVNLGRLGVPVDQNMLAVLAKARESVYRFQDTVFQVKGTSKKAEAQYGGAPQKVKAKTGPVTSASYEGVPFKEKREKLSDTLEMVTLQDPEVEMSREGGVYPGEEGENLADGWKVPRETPLYRYAKDRLKPGEAIIEDPYGGLYLVRKDRFGKKWMTPIKFKEQ